MLVRGDQYSIVSVTHAYKEIKKFGVLSIFHHREVETVINYGYERWSRDYNTLALRVTWWVSSTVTLRA